jgi:hypothetical protein
MNCNGCNSNGYRKLCNYDDENNTCEQSPHMLGLFSYMCILQENKNVCILVQEPPNSSLGRYSTMQQCRKNCKQILGQTSFTCVNTGNGKICVRVNLPPGPGRYSTMEQCRRNCLPQVNPIPTPVRPIPTPVRPIPTPVRPIPTPVRPIPTPVTPFSYKVVYTNTGPMCVKMNMFPDSSAGRYKSVDECVASMGTGRNPHVN